MSKARQAALLTAVIAVVFIALELTLHLKTAVAGVFIMGVSGGFLMSDELSKSDKGTC